jgi:uncharacterized membrane protein
MSEGGAGPTRDPSGFRLRTARMEAFSDGVFAIAVTLLVLDLVVPAVTEHDISHKLLDEWPIYLAYLVSFATIGAAWISHTAITEYLERADLLLLRLNLVLLFVVSVLPFPTRMLGEYLFNENAERLATTVYGVNLLAISVMTSVLWRYAVGAHLVKHEAPDEDLRAITRKLTPSFGLYLAAIGVGLLRPRAAVVMYLLIALFLLLPIRSIARHLRRRET